MSAELAMSGLSCVLSSHVLSEGEIHYQCGHSSLPCLECRVVCWAGTSCQKDKSTISVDTWVYNEYNVVCVELARLVRRTSPLPAWTLESTVCWVSCCVLSWHVLSEGQVHYQRGHSSLQCIECRVCWARTSCLTDGSCTSHRSPTDGTSSYTADDSPPGACLSLCWSSSVLHDSATPNLQYNLFTLNESGDDLTQTFRHRILCFGNTTNDEHGLSHIL